jgi:DNA-binding XRE family transcriptional regulator
MHDHGAVKPIAASMSAHTPQTKCANQCVPKKGRIPDTASVLNNDINYKSLVGKKVKSLRLQLKLSQETLAERCGIFRTYLSRIESGSANPSIAVLIALAQALSVAPHELLMHD